MDFGTILGLIFCSVVLYVALGIGEMGVVVDLPSMFIVFGGTASALLIGVPFTRLRKLPFILFHAIFYSYQDAKEFIEISRDMQRRARRQGTLSLEEYANDDDNDPFFTHAVHMVMDGCPQEDLEEILRTEIEMTKQRHEEGIELVRSVGTIARSFGLIGALIGLVQLCINIPVLEQMVPPLMTTLTSLLYGAALSYGFAFPIAKKCAVRSKEEIKEKERIAQAALSLINRDSVQILTRKLNAHVSPNERIKVGGW